MPLLAGDLRGRLPPLNSQEAEDDPLVHARLFLPGTDTVWYVTEGEETGQDFVLYGFVTDPVNDFGEFYLSQLNRIRGPNGASVERDEEFTPGRLTTFLPAPDP